MIKECLSPMYTLFFDKSWYAKPKDVVKFVKGLPHMCPCQVLSDMLSYIHVS